MQTGPASRSGWNLDLVVRTTARLGLLMLPAGLLLFASIQAEGYAQTLLWYGATFQALMFCFLVLTQRAALEPLGALTTISYLIAVAWLWVAQGPSGEWHAHLMQFVLLVVPLGLFALQTLSDSGAFAARRAHQLVQRLLKRKDWPAELSECRDLPEVKALREALAADASPALALLVHPRPQVRLAALSALEFRTEWFPGQPELVLRFAQQAAEPPLRAAAVTTLANIDEQPLIEMMAEFLRDPNREVRRATADALFWDHEHRWPWVRQQVRMALADPAFQNDGALTYIGPALSAEAVADLSAWSTEKGVLGVRAALTMADQYSRNLALSPDASLPQALKLRLANPQTPAALRLELAQLLKANKELDRRMQESLLDSANPAPLRLLAAEMLLAEGPHGASVAALREIARIPNREMALMAADIVQRKLGVDLGLALGQPLPAPHSRLAADVTRQLMRWATQQPVHPSDHHSSAETKLDPPKRPGQGSGHHNIGFMR